MDFVANKENFIIEEAHNINRRVNRGQVWLKQWVSWCTQWLKPTESNGGKCSTKDIIINVHVTIKITDQGPIAQN